MIVDSKIPWRYEWVVGDDDEVDDRAVSEIFEIFDKDGGDIAKYMKDPVIIVSVSMMAAFV